MHQISVFGDTKDILNKIDVDKYNRVLSGAEGVTFYCENAFALEKLKESLCKVIAEIIQKKYSNALLKSFYNSAEFDFSEEEKKIICSEFDTMSSQNSEIIEKDVGDFLENANSISVEGFVNFRLSGYKKHIKNRLAGYEASLEAVREYDDLIELLKAYVGTLGRSGEGVNILIMPAGGYIIYDDKFCDITEKCIKTVADGRKITEMSFDELLLSCLITMTPGRIVLHGENNSKNPELFILIKRIFEEIVYSCRGCSLCNL